MKDVYDNGPRPPHKSPKNRKAEDFSSASSMCFTQTKLTAVGSRFRRKR
jgi:hypothetical protein